MIATENSQLVEEFQRLAIRLRGPVGLKRLIYDFSGWFSLTMTEVLQRLGINKLLLARFSNTEPLLLNVGCGNLPENRYLNTDLVPRLGKLFAIVCQRRKLHQSLILNLAIYDPSLREKADGIILSHVLEHIPSFQTINSLKNCHRYLKQDGVIRVSVPVLDAYDKADFPKVQNMQCRVLAKNSLIYGWNHRFMYNTELLVNLLEFCGFQKIEVQNYNAGPLGETDPEIRKDESIYVTAAKI